jgi:curved DNA-binding protein
VRVTVSLADIYTGAQRTLSLQMPSVDDQGHVTFQTRTLDVAIPKGILDGQRLRLAGQGGPGMGNAPRGDLYLAISVDTPKRYRLDGRNVTTDVPLAPWEAALGAEVVVPKPSGDVTVTVPAGVVGRSALTAQRARRPRQSARRFLRHAMHRPPSCRYRR